MAVRGTIALVLCALFVAVIGQGNSPTRCTYLVIGGGAAGSYMTYRLGLRNEDVCLLELDSLLGGRIKGHPPPAGTVPNKANARQGACAMRVNDGQYGYRCLAKELGMELQHAEIVNNYFHIRGGVFNNAVGAEVRFENLPTMPDGTPGDCDNYYNYLNGEPGAPLNPMLAQLDKFDGVASFIHASLDALGNGDPAEGHAYAMACSRFKGDYVLKNNWSPRSWRETNLKETCCNDNYYPAGGLETYFEKYLQRWQSQRNVHVYLSHKVTEINYNGSPNSNNPWRYEVLAESNGAQKCFQAKYVINAAPPGQFKDIKGRLGDILNAQDQMNSIVANRVVTVTAYWESRWWESLRDHTHDETRISNDFSCLNAIEFPGHPNYVLQNSSRIGYDDGHCYDWWTLVAKRPLREQIEEVQRQVKYVLHRHPGVTASPVKWLWINLQPNAWHHVLGGRPYTHDDIIRWSRNPLPGEKIYHIGEAYHLDDSGWSFGGVKSAHVVLDYLFPDFHSQQYMDCIGTSGRPISEGEGNTDYHLTNERLPPYAEYASFPH